MFRFLCETEKCLSPTRMRFQRCQTARARFPSSALSRGSCPLWLRRLKPRLSQGAVEPESLGWVSIQGLGFSHHHCMRCCDEPAFCVQGNMWGMHQVPHRQPVLQLALAVTEAGLSLSFCSAAFMSACTGLYRHAFSCGCRAACSQSLWRCWKMEPSRVWQDLPAIMYAILRSVAGRGDHPRCVAQNVHPWALGAAGGTRALPGLCSRPFPPEPH